MESNYQGIVVGIQSSVTDCSVLNSISANAISSANSCVIRNNRVDGGAGGISCSANAIVSDNNCLSTSGSGINASGSYNRIENNQTHFNVFGIQTPPNTTNFVARNVRARQYQRELSVQWRRCLGPDCVWHGHGHQPSVGKFLVLGAARGRGHARSNVRPLKKGIHQQ